MRSFLRMVWASSSGSLAMMKTIFRCENIESTYSTVSEEMKTRISEAMTRSASMRVSMSMKSRPLKKM